MEGRNQPPRPHALIPGGASSVLGQPLHLVAQVQPQVVQVQQGAFAGPAANQIPQEDAGGKATASASQWHRVKWNSDMVKLLVSAVSYVDEDIDADHGNSSGGKRIGKWKLISSALIERGLAVSPQQCEDKFHDLNKKYKRVTEILGWGRACEIVAKPALLEQERLSAKLKEEAKKYLSSKHLHYEEMCSYHNRNRVCLLDDPVLQRTLRLMARRGPDEQGKECSFGYDENDQMFLPADNDDEDDEFSEDLDVTAEGRMNAVQIERARLKIKRDKLKLNQLKWMRSIEEQDRELQKMRLDNEKMELENDQLELELELKEMEMMRIKPKRI